MGYGEFKLVDQLGEKGYFGKVSLEVEAMENKGAITVNFDERNAAGWQSGAAFGIEYVLEHVAKHELFPHGGRVRVSSIQGHPVDTNNVVIAYVTAMALLKALGVEPFKRPDFNRESGLFVFPK